MSKLRDTTGPGRFPGNQWRRPTAVTGAFMLVAVTIALIVLSLAVFPTLLVSKPDGLDGLTGADRVQGLTNLYAARNGVRTAMIQAIAGALFFVTAFVAWRQVQATKDGQNTDRFTKAVEQLGHTAPEVRLGGLYGLRQLAERPAFVRPVAEIFAAYVRTQTVPDTGKRPAPTAPLRADIQAAVTILVVEGLWARATSARLDLSDAALPYVRLPGANLRDVILRNADLRHADLSDTDLSGSDLESARLDDARLSGARLIRANLQDAWLTGKAQLDGADLGWSLAQGAHLEGANLSHAVLTRANFQNAEMKQADLTGAESRDITDFSRADLREATLIDLTMDTEPLVDEVNVHLATLDETSRRLFAEAARSAPAAS